MSHAATNWAIRQRGLKPAAKIVLWHLADCHNGHTGQCNPRQALLAEMCEMSQSTLNVHLAELEKRGLIKRHRTIDPSTKKRRATHYTLSMDHVETPEIPESQNGTRPQDVDQPPQDVAEPCPISGDGPEFDFDDFVDRFLAKHPRPGDRDATEDALRKALDDGADPQQLIRAAGSYGREQAGNSPAYVAYSENWLRRGDGRRTFRNPRPRRRRWRGRSPRASAPGSAGSPPMFPTPVPASWCAWGWSPARNAKRWG